MGTLADAWGRMEFDSFPILCNLVLRGWLGAGLDSDTSLQVQGLIAASAIEGARCAILEKEGFVLEEYYFGLRDLFAQVIVVARKGS